jgi:hypothetical protein
MTASWGRGVADENRAPTLVMADIAVYTHRYIVEGIAFAIGVSPLILLLQESLDLGMRIKNVDGLGIDLPHEGIVFGA